MEELYNFIIGQSTNWDIYCQTRLALVMLTIEFATAIMVSIGQLGKR